MPEEWSGVEAWSNQSFDSASRVVDGVAALWDTRNGNVMPSRSEQLKFIVKPFEQHRPCINALDKQSTRLC